LPRVWPIPVALFRHHFIITLAIPFVATAGSAGSGNPLFVPLAAGQHGPGDARGLVGHGEQHHVGWPAHEKAGKPGRTDLLLAPRPAEMGARAVHQQAPDVAVTALGDAPQSLLAAARSLLRDEPEPGRKLACRAELTGIADARHHGGCGNQADPGDLSQSPACCAGGVPGEELLLDRGDLPLDRSDLRGQTLQYLSSEIGQTIVGRILDQFDELSSTRHALRGDDTEFGTVPPQRIDQHRALPNQQLAGSVQQENGLLFYTLERSEPHCWTG